jgi:hypothetical protein
LARAQVRRVSWPAGVGSVTLAAMIRLIVIAAAVLNWGTVSTADDTVAVPSNAALELRVGDRFIRGGDQPAFVIGRNPIALSPSAFDEHFHHAAEAGERFMRIHFTFMPENEVPGEIDAGMLAGCDAVLDAAEKRGLVVMPVFGVWGDWNDGSNHETWHRWDRNPFNEMRGGPAASPRLLFEDSPCRALWMKRLETLARHWAGRRNIVAWEIFSELDLVTGATEDRAVDFAERAAAVIRAADPMKRPITASQAGTNEWPKLIRSGALDFCQVHPYADGEWGGRLDELILSSVRQRLKKYGKPVMIGECGLSAAPPHGTLDVAPRADEGIRHAIWASMVSGAMSGRMLWWQDGYDQFEKVKLSWKYEEISKPAAAFVRGVNFEGFEPVECTMSEGIKGAMIGNDRERLGWFRDAACEPPDWVEKDVSGKEVTMEGKGKTWAVEFVEPRTGKARGKKVSLEVKDGRVKMALLEFRGDIAVRMRRGGN